MNLDQVQDQDQNPHPPLQVGSDPPSSPAEDPEGWRQVVKSIGEKIQNSMEFGGVEGQKSQLNLMTAVKKIRVRRRRDRIPNTVQKTVKSQLGVRKIFRRRNR